ncbi:MAG: hypothetical protein HKN37_15810 [Rhodothermales bacterium]|nr:hypothetical protein [Rhodothermales bacterium]
MMIVVVEGVSAAGKTTWSSLQPPEQVVLEAIPLSATLASSHDRASHFVDLHVRRWCNALDAEQSCGIAICDTDPFKLHYAWCELRAGLCSVSDWQNALAAHRRAFHENRLGLADAVVFLNPAESIIRHRRATDLTRRRRRFEKHFSFLPWLVEWYKAIDRVEPGRVFSGVDAEMPSVAIRQQRSGVEVFDAFLAELASVSDLAILST